MLVRLGVGDEVLKRFVDDVDVGQRCVGVLACELQVLDVGAAIEQGGLRIARAVVRRIPVDEVEQIDQVGRRAQDGTAVVARAVIHRAEQLLERRIGHDVRIGVVRCLIKDLTRAVDTDLGRGTREDVMCGDVQHRIVNLPCPAPHDTRSVFSTNVLIESTHELLFIKSGDLVGGVDALLEQSDHRLVTRRDLIDALDPFDLFGHCGRDLTTQLVADEVLLNGLLADLELVLVRGEESVN